MRLKSVIIKESNRGNTYKVSFERVSPGHVLFIVTDTFGTVVNNGKAHTKQEAIKWAKEGVM